MDGGADEAGKGLVLSRVRACHGSVSSVVPFSPGPGARPSLGHLLPDHC